MPLHLPVENPSLAYHRDIDLILRAEALGFDEFFIGEHHSAGWETIPAPEMILAMASVNAKTIRLGTAVTSLPFHHPFHIAERMAFLDHLTRGRVTLGVGPCSLKPDVKLFGLPPGDLRPMMEESIDIIVQLLESDEPVTYEGKYWNISDMALQIRSYQEPRLPMAIATTGSESGLRIAGKYGMVVLSLAGKSSPHALPFREQWPIVEQAANESGVSTSRDNWRLVTHIYLADTRKQAWSDIKEGAYRDVHQYFFNIGGKAGFEAYPDQPVDEMTVENIASTRQWIIGTPDDAIEAITLMDKQAGGIGGIMQMTQEWVGTEQVNHSMELFARYVIPHFRGHTQPMVKAFERTSTDNASGILPELSGHPTSAPDPVTRKSNLHILN